MQDTEETEFVGGRDRRLNRIVPAVWAGLLLIGQGIFSEEVPALEWIAAVWLWSGMLLVGKTACVPLLILACPAFMCENQRAWAWVQPVLVGLLLARVVFENKFGLRRILTVILVGAVALVLSWPHDAGELLANLAQYPARELVKQFIGPHASWAMFPFRQSVDRALIAGVVAALLIAGGYVSTHRIRRAFAGALFLAVTAAFCAALVPWQQHHRFLGTTNYSSYHVHPFHGAGYNLSFFAMLVGLGLPWLLFWPGKRRAIVAGCCLILIPCLLIEQLALELAILAYAWLALMIVGYAMARPELRRRCRFRLRASRRQWQQWGGASLGGLLLSVAWFLKVSPVIGHKISLQLSVMTERIVAMLRFWPVLLLVSATGLCCAFGLGMLPGRARYRLRALALTLSGRRAGLVLVLVACAIGTMCLISAGRSAAANGAERGVLGRRLSGILARDSVRGPMWMQGLAAIGKKPVLGYGAGTWARYQKSQPRPSRTYYAHMHNMYLDLLFEYGLVPMLIVFGACVGFLLRIVFVRGSGSRLWLFYLCGVAVMGIGQHLMFAFTTMCLLLPAFILIPRVLMRDPPLAVGGETR